MSKLLASQLFYDNWTQLSEQDAWRIVYHQQAYNKTYPGYHIKAVLKAALRPNFKKTFKKLTAEQIRDIYHDKGIFFNQPFTHFFTTSLKAGGTILAAPEELLSDCSFMHFYYADAAFSKIAVLEHEKQDITMAINEFIATLYLPFNGENKLPFNENRVSDFANKLKLLPYQSALLIKSYHNIKMSIISRCPHLFPQPVAGATSPSTPTYTGVDWQNLHFDVAESEAFKGFDQSGQANLYKVLDYLEYKAKNKTKSA